MTKKILAILIAALCIACTKAPEQVDMGASTAAQQQAAPDSGEGRLYLADLAAAIISADRIVVTEHSIDDDVLDAETHPQLPKGYVPIIYASHELSARQRSDFYHAIRTTAPTTQDAFTACIFEPHHSVTFFRAGKQTSEIKICFQCGDIQWDGSNKTQPWALLPTLSQLITSTGMHTKRDWRMLAKNHAQ